MLCLIGYGASINSVKGQRGEGVPSGDAIHLYLIPHTTEGSFRIDSKSVEDLLKGNIPFMIHPSIISII